MRGSCGTIPSLRGFFFPIYIWGRTSVSNLGNPSSIRIRTLICMLLQELWSHAQTCCMWHLRKITRDRFQTRYSSFEWLRKKGCIPHDRTFDPFTQSVENIYIYIPYRIYFVVFLLSCFDTGISALGRYLLCHKYLGRLNFTMHLEGGFLVEFGDNKLLGATCSTPREPTSKNALIGMLLTMVLHWILGLVRNRHMSTLERVCMIALQSVTSVIKFSHKSGVRGTLQIVWSTLNLINDVLVRSRWTLEWHGYSTQNKTSTV